MTRPTDYHGIDYGLGTTNIDHETGIRFGVINQDDILQAWAEVSEADFGPPTCPKCGNEAAVLGNGDAPDTIPDLDDEPEGWEIIGTEYACEACQYAFDGDEAFGDEPACWHLDDGEYVATQSRDDSDIFITKSPYYTHAQFCSPCAPGACHLKVPTDETGPRAYCFAPDWFDYWTDSGTEPTGEYNGQKTSCPYPVYRVKDGACVFTPYNWPAK
jgi:hypothetical protein